jgi:hypothetical protein
MQPHFIRMKRNKLDNLFFAMESAVSLKFIMLFCEKISQMFLPKALAVMIFKQKSKV